MKKFKIVSYILVSMMLISGITAFAAVDDETPSDVEGLKAEALDSAVKLTWKAATDNVGVSGYQVHYGKNPVTKSGETYDEVEKVGKVTEYTVDELDNDTKYYFSVIAFDEAGNESLAWAIEASATPKAGAGDATDKDSPQVVSAKVEDKNTVLVEFSEQIVLPKEDPEQSFTIENQDSLELLNVTAAEIDEDDETGKTVKLTTEDQKKDIEYKITVGVKIEDKAGNPIVSGTSDTAVFDGTDAVASQTDEEAPKIVSIEAVDNKSILINFNESIVLSIDPSENFEILESVSGEKLEVLNVILGKNDQGVQDAAVIITTAPQEEKTYKVTVKNITDEAGNKIAEPLTDNFDGIIIPPTGGDDEEEDTVAPKDIAEFMANAVAKGESYLVTLTWQIPEDRDEDVISQIIYQSTKKDGNFEEEAVLGSDVTKYEVENLSPGEYWFKITQKDAAGNESEGIITQVILAETGPEMLGLLAFSIGLGRIFRKKRNKV